MKSLSEPFIYDKEESEDHRGSLEYYNTLELDPYKRFYIVTNPKEGTVRAWHGHKLETKLVRVLKGRFIIFTIKIDNWENPSQNLIPNKYEMNENSGILYIPPGYANGAINLDENGKIMYFSSSNLLESHEDDHRFESKFWNPWEEYSPEIYE